MKEEQQRNHYQKQMLINRLYKSKNTPAVSKQLPKPQEQTKLLFYQTKKKSFREDEPKKILPIIGLKRPSLHEELPPSERTIGSARRTSRGGSFTKDFKQIHQNQPMRRSSVRVPSNIKVQPLSSNVIPSVQKLAQSPTLPEISNSQVATFFKMVRQKKLTADEFIYMVRSNQNDHYNMEVVAYSSIINKKIQDYYTFSCKGVSKFVNSKPTEFIPVEEWFEEVRAFNQICKYNFFIMFRKWKCLKKWMKIISNDKHKTLSRLLEEKMFLTNKHYRTVIVNHQTLCAQIENLTFINFAGRDPITKEDLLFKKQENNKQFSAALHAFSKKMHQNSQKGIQTVLATLKDSIKKEDSKKQDALGFPENMNYGDRSMMRHQLIRIVRVSYLLEYMSTQSLGKCYINNINTLFKMIQLPYDQIEEYQNKMAELKWIDPSREGNLQLERKATSIAPPPSQSTKNEANAGKSLQKKKIQSILKVVFNLNPSKILKQKVRDFDEDEPKNLLKFDLNYWELNKIRQFQDSVQMIQITPFEEELTDILVAFFKESSIEKGIKNWRNNVDIFVDSLEQWDDVIGGRNRDRQNMSEYIDPSFWLKQFPIMTELVPRIRLAMKESYEQVYKFRNEYRTYLDAFARQKQTVYQDLQQGKFQSVNQMYINLVKLNQWLYSKMTDNLAEMNEVSIYQISCYELNKQIVSGQEENRRRLTKFVQKHLEVINDECEKFYNKNIIKLSVPMVSIDNFSTQRDNIAQINRSITEMSEKVSLMSLMPDLLPEMKNINLKKKVQKTIALSAQGGQLITQVEDLCTSSVDKFKKEYKQLQRKINRQLQQLITDVTDKKWLTEYGGGIVEYKPKVDKLQAQVQQMQGYEQVLDITGQGNYQNLYTLKQQFDLRYSLWKGLDDFSALSKEWSLKVLSSIEVKPMMQIVDKYFRVVSQCQRNLSENPIVPKLKTMVTMYKESLPAVNALKSQNLLQEHIIQINQILGTVFDQKDETLTLQKLFNLKIQQKSGSLIEIATKALQQKNLRQTLSHVEKVLNQSDMLIKPYREVGFVLGGVDDLTIILDQCLANVTNTLANRYIKPLKVRAQKLSQQIQLFMDIIEKWIEAQRKWMYLENIFSAPDIKTQLKDESKIFQTCDKFIKAHVKKLNTSPKIIRLAKPTNLLAEFIKTTESLQQIQKNLEKYLQGKRKIFPRFYFLSNDELLEILSRSDNLQMVEQYLGKCFEALVKLYMGEGKTTADSRLIEGMFSPEKERVNFKTMVNAKNGVEVWLGHLQKEMFDSVRRIISVGYNQYIDGKYKKKVDWIMAQPSQVVAVACQIIWTITTQDSIRQNQKTGDSIQNHLNSMLNQLKQLTAIVRGQIPAILRKIIVALITIEVHNRDIVTSLKEAQCQSLNDFLWQQQLRYYIHEDRTIHKQVTSLLEYGYQYLGATSRLVITPLTDRCWITITSALANKLGANPAGPAGTGKTQSTKDLAKALGRLCIVFNCSDQITAKMMSKLFKGLAQQGAWACLDEFNRIDIQVLSVIAQQLLIIHMALKRDRPHQEFEFEDDVIPLLPNYGVFITMNPGYAGRTELPDNLKSLFRPVAMMIPDYAMIAEIMLFAEGFQTASILSKKMVQLYKLSSEQLSQQDHYDFGMRAVKSLLVMAGSLKRAEPNLEEDSILIKAMKFSNIPKFVKADIPLFTALILDLFPTTVVPETSKSKLEEIIPAQLKKSKLQPSPPFQEKIIQLYDTFNVRFGVMLVGQSGSGKSTCFKMLAQCSTVMKEAGEKGFERTFYKILNPKSISMGEMYGEVDVNTQEWVDGLASSIIREVNNPNTEDSDWNPNDRYWVTFDGPVDALWIQNMNTVLDDNMTLCLANSQRIKLRPQLRMLFEVQDLAVASPATVSRCGMVYLSFDNLPWILYVKSWLQKSQFTQPQRDILQGLFNKTLQKAFKKKKKLYEPFPSTIIQCATNICNILQSMRSQMKLEFEQLTAKVLTVHYIFAVIWGLGGGVSNVNNPQIQAAIEETFNDFTFPRSQCVFDHLINPQTQQNFISWTAKVPQFQFDKEVQFFDLLVPTIDTVKYSYIVELMVDIQKPVILTGESGVGKSVLIKTLLESLKQRKRVSTIFLNFSAQTKAKDVQLAIESKLIKKGKTLFGARPNQKICVFIDDVNMPALEFYGAQPCIQLLRQLVDLGSLYDRHKLFKKQVVDTTLLPVCGPPGGGRNQLSFRFLRQLLPLMFPTPSSSTAFKIFNSLLAPKCSYSEPIVLTTLQVFQKISKELLPTPSKFQYVYNMRDVGKVIENIGKGKQQFIVKIFVHELRRVFADRMIKEDYNWFKQVVFQAYKRYFSNISFLTDDTFNVLFTDIMKLDSGVSMYEEVTDARKLYKLLENKQHDFNYSSNDKLDLVFFDDAVEQILRICRILRQPRGNAMLIGVGGSGKQSLSKLASFIMKCEPFQIQMAKSYNCENFRQDLRKITRLAGGQRRPLTFIFTDAQIVYESFLEDINNILNTGEVPNLFTKKDDIEAVANLVRPYAIKKKVQDSPEPLWNLFISCIRQNLHIILCMSPVGQHLRVRCRKFPSLINCCSLDWFPNWPKEALIEVANKFIKNIVMPDEKIKAGLTEMCMNVSIDVTELCDRYGKQLRRKVYTTPKSYLDHIKLYQKLLEEKRDQIQKIKRKLTFGLEKLYTTNQTVIKLQGQMTILKPQLAEQSIKTEQFLKQLAIDTQQASKVEATVGQQAQIVNNEQQQIKIITDQAQIQLNKAIPALQAAADALKKLNKADITEIKGFSQPPDAVRMVLQGVCILLGEKSDWDGAKKVMTDMSFLDRLRQYDRNALADKDALLKKLRVVTKRPEFDIEQIGRKSVACKSLAMWVKAMDNYARISKDVEPKKKKVAELAAKLQVKNKQLKIKQDQLNKIKEKVQKLQKECDQTFALKKKLQEDMIRTNNRLVSAEKLTVLLQQEGIRWKQQIQNIAQQLNELIGNVFLSAATISYLGPFTGAYRDPMIKAWKQKFTELGIPFSQNYSLSQTLQTPLTIRQWIIQGLSNDALSIDNGVIATKCQRWPLFIDPQGQAHKWIKKHQQPHHLSIINFSDQNYLKTIKTAIECGYSILLQNVEQKLEPSLDSVLQKQIYQQDNRMLIRVGDQKTDYDKAFRMFITTKMSNPHYLPEIYIKVTIINFSITFEGLKDQLLGDVVKFQLPQIEKQKDEVVVSISEGKKLLKLAQDNILTLLSQSKGNILDNVELIKTLQESKKNSAIIKKKLEQTTAIEETINVSRNSYIPVAIRGTVLYFVISELALIDPMYQFSLGYFKKLFLNGIQSSLTSNQKQERINNICDSITKLMFTNICRGLFESHKKIYSFLICTAIRRQNKIISYSAWNYLVRGTTKTAIAPNPDPAFLSLAGWDFINYAEDNFPQLKGIASSIKNKMPQWKEFVKCQNLIKAELPEQYKDISSFARLALVRGLCFEKIMRQFSNYVLDQMGSYFDQIKTTSLDEIFSTSDYKTPLIFILSTGADPTSALLKFANQKFKQFSVISLGQGQGVKAEKTMDIAQAEGNWVLLTNCHLAKSWMPDLEKKVLALHQNYKGNQNYRLFLTSMPADYFPVSILQNSSKLTLEPPRGLKSNLKKSFMQMNDDFLKKKCERKNKQWHKLAFTLSFFHAIIQQRRKFGPLGFNIRYEFNDSDLSIAYSTLEMFLSIEQQVNPWDAMLYMTGHINYGGRVSDDWDRVCLLSILKKYYNQEIINNQKFALSASKIYFVPQYADLKTYQEYIAKLPNFQDPQVFGMHENANITYQNQQSTKIMETILSIQPRISAASTGKSPDQIVMEMATQFMNLVPQILDQTQGNQDHFQLTAEGNMRSLSIVLLQQITKFNILLRKMKVTLGELKKAIQGFAVMSQELDQMYLAFQNNMLPGIWRNVSYSSLKPLSSWFKDLINRVTFIREWLHNKAPFSYWMSGFYFPQGYLTGVLQTHARQYKIPIDTLSFKFKVLALDKDKLVNSPEDGVYIDGLYLDGARWDTKDDTLVDQVIGKLYFPMPVIHFLPSQNYVPKHAVYKCPCYKTSNRAGVLSTTGQSTNFILPVDLNTKSQNHPAEFWTLRGTALLCQLDD